MKKQLIFVSLLLSLFSTISFNILAMNSKTKDQRREDCRFYRKIINVTKPHIDKLKEEAQEGNAETLTALKEFKDSCANRSKISSPASRIRLARIGFLDDEDKATRSICEAYSQQTFEECYKYSLEQ